MSNVAYANFGQSQGIQPLSFDEIDAISGASKLGEDVLLFAGAGGLIGAWVGGGAGAAVGVIAGAAVAVVLHVVEN